MSGMGFSGGETNLSFFFFFFFFLSSSTPSAWFGSGIYHHSTSFLQHCLHSFIRLELCTCPLSIKTVISVFSHTESEARVSSDLNLDVLVNCAFSPDLFPLNLSSRRLHSTLHRSC